MGGLKIVENEDALKCMHKCIRSRTKGLIVFIEIEILTQMWVRRIEGLNPLKVPNAQKILSCFTAYVLRVNGLKLHQI